ncbi:MAG: FHA domain-containing protein [Gammaproteobacteria bacterium]|nr:FHA domain-containing protein [Gammaproteobacteria bacterium]
MERLIIKQGRRHGRLSEFIKSTGDTLTLGRGFNNDITLSDHYIAAEQIRFEYHDGQWKIALLDNTNPVLINDKQINNDGTVVNNGDRLTIGRTELVLLLSNHPLERTRKLMLSNWMYHNGLRIILPLLMLLVSGLLAILTEYQGIADKIRWGQLAIGGLAYILIVVFWAGGWALVGRLLRHQPNFFAQLFYTALLLACLTIGMMFQGYTEYATMNSIIGKTVEWGFLLIIISMLLKFNLSYASELKNRGQVSVLIVAVSILCAILMTYLGQRDFSTKPDYSDTLKPPLAKWSSDKSIDAYMQDVRTQFGELDKILNTEATME